MIETGTSAEALGEKLKRTGQAVRRYRNGERMPEPEVCDLIETITSGAVTVADLHKVRLAKLRGQSNEAAA